MDFLIHNNYNSHCLKGISLIHNHSSGNHNSGNIGEDILGNKGAYNNDGSP